MKTASDNTKHLNALLEELSVMRDQLELTSARLEEANDTLRAIKAGEVDALVVRHENGPQLFTLKSADHTYRIFIEQLTEGVVTLNTAGYILYCNSSFAELVKQPHEKVIGQDFCGFISVTDEENCKELIKKAWQNNTRGEIKINAGSGHEIPVLLSCKRLDLEENLTLSIILTDLSSQKEQQQQLLQKNLLLEEAEKTARHINTNLETLVSERTKELEKTVQEKIAIGEQLRNNQERLTQILETMAEGVAIMGIDGTITYANRMAQQMLGLREISRQNKTMYDTDWKLLTIEGVQLQQQQAPVYISMVSGKPVYDYEIGVESPGKDRTYISINAVPVWNENNRVTGAIGTFMDVTRRRIAIQQKDDFIGVASHELKTPITTLQAALQLLDRIKNEPDHQMLPRLIEQANKGMKKINYLVEDLLDVSRLKEGHLQLNKKIFLLEDMLQDAVEHLQIHGQNTVIISGDKTIEVLADQGRIEQVVVNFINNAVKYAPESKEIAIVVKKKNDLVKISVTDQGPGIAAEKQGHLFDRYFRTDYSGVQYSGLGLGLYISSEIVKKHEGNIGVQSELGSGSTFWFTLPCKIIR